MISENCFIKPNQVTWWRFLRVGVADSGRFQVDWLTNQLVPKLKASPAKKCGPQKERGKENVRKKKKNVKKPHLNLKHIPHHIFFKNEVDPIPSETSKTCQGSSLFCEYLGERDGIKAHNARSGRLVMLADQCLWVSTFEEIIEHKQCSFRTCFPARFLDTDTLPKRLRLWASWGIAAEAPEGLFRLKWNSLNIRRFVVFPMFSRKDLWAGTLLVQTAHRNYRIGSSVRSLISSGHDYQEKKNRTRSWEEKAWRRGPTAAVSLFQESVHSCDSGCTQATKRVAGLMHQKGCCIW